MTISYIKMNILLIKFSSYDSGLNSDCRPTIPCKSPSEARSSVPSRSIHIFIYLFVCFNMKLNGHAFPLVILFLSIFIFYFEKVRICSPSFFTYVYLTSHRLVSKLPSN